mmetsp:Transcript_21241/g.38108  ORF Transcript_21241/g.38108 Transcript_21241/m.38108 type:complete len:321 (-) Transcript_21241:84-1046(-)
MVPPQGVGSGPEPAGGPDSAPGLQSSRQLRHPNPANGQGTGVDRGRLGSVGFGVVNREPPSAPSPRHQNRPNPPHGTGTPAPRPSPGAGGRFTQTEASPCFAICRRGKPLQVDVGGAKGDRTRGAGRGSLTGRGPSLGPAGVPRWSRTLESSEGGVPAYRSSASKSSTRTLEVPVVPLGLAGLRGFSGSTFEADSSSSMRNTFSSILPDLRSSNNWACSRACSSSNCSHSSSRCLSSSFSRSACSLACRSSSSFFSAAARSPFFRSSSNSKTPLLLNMRRGGSLAYDWLELWGSLALTCWTCRTLTGFECTSLELVQPIA